VKETDFRRISSSWRTSKRWNGIIRPYTPADVLKLRGSVHIRHTLAEMGAERLWDLLHTEDYVPAMGALTGSQAVQQVQAGLKAIYVSGWQVAADANDAGMYPDLGLYPADGGPSLVRRINNALLRADQIQHSDGRMEVHWFAPIVADAEAGFGGPLNAFEVMKAMIEAGAAGVHFEDQVASARKCGHLGGKGLVPTKEFVQKLVAARLAADVLGVPTILIARTDAHSASFVTSDIDHRDCEFLTGERTEEGYFVMDGGLEAATARALAYAPYADLLWFETSSPDLDEAAKFADAVHAKYPGKLLAYNLSPSFNWAKRLDADTIAEFQRRLGAMGYKFQFVTLAGFHSLNYAMFQLAMAYAKKGMSAYADFQQAEFAAKEQGYRAVEHQSFVGTAYYDKVLQVISGGGASTLSMEGSTEREQFRESISMLGEIVSTYERLRGEGNVLGRELNAAGRPIQMRRTEKDGSGRAD